MEGQPDDAPVPHRRIRLVWPDDTRAAWQPAKPEFAAAVNALSLGMPHGEPYVMRSVRRAVAGVDDPILHERVAAYLEQEGEHSRQHRRFNEVVTAQHPSLRRVERWLARSYRLLDRLGPKFGVAYAAGFEATAFAAARWMDAHRHELFRGADPEPATLILWHLAEEVEHKAAAHEVNRAAGGGRIRYLGAMAVSLLLVMAFVGVGTTIMLAAERRLMNPIAWWRLSVWAVTFAFDLIPTLVVSALPGFHPAQWADPLWYEVWLRELDRPDHS